MKNKEQAIEQLNYIAKFNNKPQITSSELKER